MPIRIIINGAPGKMGRIACEALENNPEFNIVGRLSRQNNLREEILFHKPDVVLDLTRADSVFDNCLAILEGGSRPVIGTSGLSDSQVKELQNLSKAQQLGGLIVPNFSIAAVLMMQFSAKAARFISNVEIIESHHPQKFDAPSGTAIKTAQMIADAQVKNETPMFKETIPGVRGGKCNEISIHSIRLPGIVAKQEVIFGAFGETLTLVHETIDRAAFKPGILLACQKAMHLSSLYYGLETVL